MNTKNTIAFAAIFSIAAGFTACKKSDFKSTDTGLKYKVLSTNDTGRSISEGDVITFHCMAVAGDTTFLNTFMFGMPFYNIPVANQYPGDINEGFQLMKTGDSTIFELSADSLFMRTFNQKETPAFAVGKQVFMTIKMVDRLSKEEVEVQQEAQRKEMEEFERKQEENTAAEKTNIENYIAAKKLKNVQTTETGLKYIVKSKGSGPKVEQGDMVKVHYTGTLLDGTKFDSSVDRGEPFQFNVGFGQVILGWDEAVSMMSVGDKYMLIIPFNLGYGYSGQGSIPPFSTLVFDIEVLDKEKGQ